MAGNGTVCEERHARYGTLLLFGDDCADKEKGDMLALAAKTIYICKCHSYNTSLIY